MRIIAIYFGYLIAGTLALAATPAWTEECEQILFDVESERSSDEVALIKACEASPQDDLPRLVYADWLEDHGQPERAEFIRLQIRVHQKDGTPAVLAKMRRRANALRESHAHEWLRVSRWLNIETTWARGFLVGLSYYEHDPYLDGDLERLLYEEPFLEKFKHGSLVAFKPVGMAGLDELGRFFAQDFVMYRRISPVAFRVLERLQHLDRHLPLRERRELRFFRGFESVVFDVHWGVSVFPLNAGAAKSLGEFLKKTKENCGSTRAWRNLADFVANARRAQ